MSSIVRFLTSHPSPTLRFVSCCDSLPSIRCKTKNKQLDTQELSILVQRTFMETNYIHRVIDPDTVRGNALNMTLENANLLRVRPGET